MIVKSNNLITASYYLTLNEMRLLDLALAELSSYEQSEKHLAAMPDFIEIRAQEYAELYEIDLKKAYAQLKEASDKLFSRYFTYRVKSELYPSHYEERKARWVQEIGYIEGKGLVTLSFTKVLIALAGRLDSSFGRYHLEQKSKLTSIYAHRLYEMAVAWRGKKTTGNTIKEVPYVSYHELRDRFKIDNKQYETMSNFKRVVLDVAIKQINDSTDINISYEQVKQGKTIIGFTFTFKMKKSDKLIAKNLSEIKLANKVVKDNNKKIDNADLMLKKIPALSVKQRNTFANKLVNDFEFKKDFSVSKFTYGKSREEVVRWVEQGLADDEKRQEWRRYLLIAGYEFPEKLKK